MIFKLIVKNIFRHKLRALLTILGIAVAVMSFGLLRTIISTWYSGSNNAAPDRLITRQAVSFVFPLPLADMQQIERVPGVKAVSYENWFGGVYIDSKHFFSRFAVDADNIFTLYPEYMIPPDQLTAFKNDRDGCIIGQKLAEQYNFKIGDIIQLTGDIYPGQWQFVVRGIYKGSKPSVEETAMFFHWDYLNEYLVKNNPGRANNVGWYVVQINNPNDAAQVSAAIDNLFLNSNAETKTETEKAFAQSFVSMSSAIITSLQIVSYVIIGIIFLVLANTMVMTARERIREYAVLKTLGFTAGHLVTIIAGESLSIAIIGGAIGIILTFPICIGFGKAFAMFFPAMVMEPMTFILAGGFAIIIGILAAVFPAERAASIKIVDGLRQVG
ncbi:MAG TPA: FtsX-like permease family protein [Candidatus Kapabacteria bacterium]|nr:FtsX-like permease family protein [Candidatus Kapabacteria bacterium]